MENMFASPDACLSLIHTKSLVLSLWECAETTTYLNKGWELLTELCSSVLSTLKATT